MTITEKDLQEFFEFLPFAAPIAQERGIAWGGSYSVGSMMGVTPAAWVENNPDHARAAFAVFRQYHEATAGDREFAQLDGMVKDLEVVANGGTPLSAARNAVLEALGVSPERALQNAEIQRYANMSNEEVAAMRAQKAEMEKQAEAQRKEDARLQRAITAAVLIGRLQTTGAKLDNAANDRLKAAGIANDVKEVNDAIADKSFAPFLLGYEDATLMVLVNELTGLLQSVDAAESYRTTGSSRLIQL